MDKFTAAIMAVNEEIDALIAHGTAHVGEPPAPPEWRTYEEMRATSEAFEQWRKDRAEWGGRWRAARKAAWLKHATEIDAIRAAHGFVPSEFGGLKFQDAG